jgi:hypothetical protein
MRRFLTALVVVALLGACGSADSSDSAVTTESSAPKPVFHFATDSVCDWFTPEDMNEIVAVAQQRAGTDYDLKAFDSSSLPECRRLATMWKAEEPSSPGHRVWFQLEPLGVEPRWSPYEEPNPDEFVGHSLLDDDVTYQTRSYQFAWKAGLDGFVQVDGHQDEILYFGLAVHTMEGQGTNEYEELGLAMVNEVLERMNWINSEPSVSDAFSGDGAPIEPSGIVLAGSSGWGTSAVVDGAGMVWIDGPFELTRLDPQTGEATTWDAADDLTFATITAIAPSDGAGVWLAGGGRVRRFDGDRFVVDLTVPDEFLGPAGRIEGLVVDGETLWIAIDDGDDHVVARMAQGSWTRLPGGLGGPLAVDSDGNLWAVKRGAGGTPIGLSRFDGTTWSRPGSSGTYPTGQINSIVADPEGGVWVLTKETLAHFDGASWSQTRVPQAIGEIPWWPALLAVDPDGRVWVAGMNGVARYDPDGEWSTFKAAEGLPAHPGGELRNVVVAGDEVVVVTTVGAHRLDGTRFVPLWADPAFGQRFTGPLVAVSSNEVWARADSGVWSRYRDGEWEAVGPQDARRQMGYGSGVVASDGAVWVLTTAGLVRVDGDDWSVMSEDATSWQQPAAGPDGSVWAIEESDDVASVVKFHADGTRTTIDPPILWPERLAVGPDGALWAAGGWDLARWDGTWQQVPPPPGWSPYWVSGLEATPDGALWVSGIAPNVFARYADGEWTTFEHDALQVGQQLVALSDGTVCITPFLACFDATGTIVGTIAETLPGVFVDGIDIAPDGAVWVHGEQIARLPDGALP